MRFAAHVGTRSTGDVWAIPASRMKGGLAHRVPLSAAALDVLNLAREYADSSGLIFPSPTGRVLSDNTLSKLFRDLGIAGTCPTGCGVSIQGLGGGGGRRPHDCRARVGARRGLSATERAYRRTDLFEARRAVMEQWARACQS